MVALMSMLHKQFGDMINELMRKKIDMVSYAKHHVYIRNKKGRRGLDEARREKGENWM